jgi:non-specific serine/threonine protein kinase
MGPASAGTSGHLSSRDEQLVLCPDGRIWVDVEAFEEATATARRGADPAAYRAALSFYAGELLPMDRYEDWAGGRRVRLRRSFVHLLIDLASLYEEHGDFAPAAEALRTALAEEPADEEAHASLMRLLALSGHKAEAIEQYERLRDALFGEPDVATRRLRDEISADRFPPDCPLLADHRPSEDPAEVHQHNLPVARTSFVGRTRERVELKGALATARHLTLTGAGGSGKTRLALELARDLAGAYPDGVWLVDLAPLADPGLVPRALAATLEVQEKPGRSLIETLAEALRGKQTLLLLDNCEHLVDSVARLVDALLDECPGLRVLSTSREALGIVGELVWPVPPLSVPDTRRPPTVEQLEGCESARLFVERARLRNPAFVVGPQNARAVAEICTNLDGLPLAIELAAARAGVLSVGQISARLSRSLEVLSGGGRSMPPRQRTLNTTLEWSHELLGRAERALFSSLSIFAGGFSLEAAEAVGTGDGVDAEEVLDLLARLVDKSLVTAQTPVRSEGATRYRMLGPVRRYAAQQLEDREVADEVRGQHAAFFLALAEEAERGLEGPEQEAWTGTLQEEYDNLRVALSWSIDEDPEAALRLAGAMRRFWFMRGYTQEGLDSLNRALARPGADFPRARAKALIGAGFLAYARGDYEQAIAWSGESLALNRRLQDDDGIARALGTLGTALTARGEYERAAEIHEECLALDEKRGDKRGIAFSLGELGELRLAQGDFRSAADLLGQSLEAHRGLRDTHSVAVTLGNLAEAARGLGEHERSAALAQESLALFQELESEYGVAHALLALGSAQVQGRNHRGARASLRASLSVSERLGLQAVTADCLDALASLAVAQGWPGRAARLFGAAQGQRETFGAPLFPSVSSSRAPFLRAARSGLDEAAFDAAWAQGRLMSSEEAVAYALSEDPEAVGEQPAFDTLRRLTRREEEVADLLARRMTNRQIATELFLSERTVENHVASILKKLGLRSRKQVAAR